MRHDPVFDLVGVGFGPSNIALAIALEELEPGLRWTFLERRQNGLWQEEMLLAGSDIQNNAMRDLVTPRNPQSRYTFINYLKQAGRLLDYLNLDLHYPLRKDYAQYIAWVESHFADQVRYGADVRSIGVVQPEAGEGDPLWRIATADGQATLARAVVLGPGRQARVPEPFLPHRGPRVFHLTEYLSRIAQMSLSGAHVAVVGASQSAVEILLDLMRRDEDVRISAVHRAYGFRLKDTSPFSNHVYFPEFIDYFYESSPPSRRSLAKQLRPTNYSSADADVLHELYVRLYEERLDGRQRVTLRNNTDIDAVEDHGDRITLRTREIHRDELGELDVDAVILATGFLDLGVGDGFAPTHPLLAAAAGALSTDDRGVLLVDRDYRVPTTGANEPALYLNGLCESTHGMGDAGSFSLVSLRAAVIAESAIAFLRAEPAGPVTMPLARATT